MTKSTFFLLCNLIQIAPLIIGDNTATRFLDFGNEIELHRSRI